MTVAPTIELVTAMQRLSGRVGQALAGVIAFAVLSGAWLAYFTFVPFDFRIR